MLILLFSMCLVMMVMFLYSPTPLYMSSLIILQTVCLAVIIFMLTSVAWFSFVLLMIFITGMMIIFIYVSSISSNMLFNKKFNLNYIYIWLVLFVSVFICFWFIKSFSDVTLNSLGDLFVNPLSLFVYKPFSEYLMGLTVFFMVYLLFTLFVVVKNSVFLKGPLCLKP
uniref:NADH dehydrogenase subunit 6 n=1 Tax=Hirondellea gigas TaxID=1518452 RepID=A0A1B1RRY7_9CRUS|nr:NADH dehydrogenase subunit 6 [Hirondellea gigas]